MSVLRTFHSASNGAFLLISLLFSVTVIASSRDLDTSYAVSELQGGNTTVEVLGTLRGSGWLALIQGKPRIITNSHLLQGAPSATIILPTGSSTTISFTATLEFDSPLGDVAVLAPASDIGVKLHETLRSKAKLNGAFCKKGARACTAGFRPGGYSTSPQDAYFWLYESEIKIYSVMNGSKRQTPFLAYYYTTEIPDTYVSGHYSKILKLPALAAPGMSGSPVFGLGGRIKAILSKIEMGGAGEAFGIPVEEIAKILGPHYFKSQDELKLPRSAWEQTPDGKKLTAMLDGQRVTDPGQPARIHEAGGDTGNGGNTRSSSRNWEIGVSDKLRQNSGDFSSGSIRRVTTPDPFQIGSGSSLELDGNPVGYLRVKNTRTGELLLQAATVARYLWLKRNKEFTVEPVFMDQLTQSPLHSARAKDQKVPKFTRVYQKIMNGTMQLITGVSSTVPLTTGAVEVQVCAANSDSDNCGGALVRVNPSRKNVLDIWIDLTRFANLRAIDRIRPSTMAHIEIPKDLSEVRLSARCLHGTKSLRCAVSPQALTVHYTAPGGQRAVLLYNDQDITKLDRLYVDSGPFVYELIYCEIGRECYR